MKDLDLWSTSVTTLPKVTPFQSFFFDSLTAEYILTGKYFCCGMCGLHLLRLAAIKDNCKDNSKHYIASLKLNNKQQVRL
jgi:hypothetical protein